MSKVDLEKVRLSNSALTDKVYVGITDNNNKFFKKKKDVTLDFMGVLISKYSGYETKVTVDDKKYTIIVTEEE